MKQREITLTEKGLIVKETVLQNEIEMVLGPGQTQDPELVEVSMSTKITFVSKKKTTTFICLLCTLVILTIKLHCYTKYPSDKQIFFFSLGFIFIYFLFMLTVSGRYQHGLQEQAVSVTPAPSEAQ